MRINFSFFFCSFIVGRIFLIRILNRTWMNFFSSSHKVMISILCKHTALFFSFRLCYFDSETSRENSRRKIFGWASAKELSKVIFVVIFCYFKLGGFLCLCEGQWEVKRFRTKLIVVFVKLNFNDFLKFIKIFLLLRWHIQPVAIFIIVLKLIYEINFRLSKIYMPMVVKFQQNGLFVSFRFTFISWFFTL